MRLFLQFLLLSMLLFLCNACKAQNAPPTQIVAVAQSAAPAQSEAPLALQHVMEVEPREIPGIIPQSLSIPSIGLKAPVEPVGVLDNGQMGVPDAFDSVGVLLPWTLPGQPGNAVIAGHVDHKTGPAIFYHLTKLKAGDRFSVSGGSGESYTYAVRSVEKFKVSEAPLQRIFGKADTPRLNLITCTGKFNKITHEHSHRLVVFGEMVNEEKVP